VRWTTLLRALPRDLRDAIAGDLAEEYIVRCRRNGRARAAAWRWAAAARLAARFRIERLTHDRGVPPIGDEVRTRTPMWEPLRQDVVFSVRLLRRQPGFAAIALLALALGIAANTAIFSVVDAVLWRPLPFRDAGRIMALSEQRPREGLFYGPVSPADFFDWRSGARSFSAMSAVSDMVLNLTGSGEPERLIALSVSPGFLEVLGVAPSVGRAFRAEEEVVGRHRVVLLSDALWRRRFGADPRIVGQSIALSSATALDSNRYQIVGILPRDFWWSSSSDVIVPLALDDHDRTLRGAHFLDVIARLRDGASEAQAREELRVIGAQLSQQYPDDNANHAPNLRPLRSALVADVRPALLLLLGAVGCVLLIACANVATLLLARATGRQKELSVRRAVGATQGRLVRQMLTESVTIAAVGGAVGVVLATWSLAALRTLLPAQFSELPGIDRLGIDPRVLSAAAVMTLATGIVFGVLPALVASDQTMATMLHSEARGSSGSRRTVLLRSALVVVELACSLVLLVGAGLLIVSFYRVLDVSPGFRTHQLATVGLTLPASRYRSQRDAVVFYEQVMERLRAIPAVQSVAATSAPPFSGLDGRLNLEIERRTWDLQGPVRAHPRMISAGYFETLSIPVKRGRALSERDHADAPLVAVINETAARRFWPDGDPIGQRISLGGPARWMEIVGIVGDVRHDGLNHDPEPEVFVPQRQGFYALGNAMNRAMTLVVRTAPDGVAIAPEIRAAVHAIDPLQPIGRVRTMDEMVNASVAPRRLNFILLSAFACVAVALTAAGLYGVMSYLVIQRTREIGMRMALGASRAQVLSLVVRQVGVMTGAGIGIGIAGALVATRTMASLLFGVSPADPRIYVAVSLLLGGVALAAAAVPSSRATRIDPLIALREP